jgi:hypothetical protein
MWILPYFFKSSHALVCSREAGCNVVIVAEVVGDLGAKIFEFLAESNISVSNVNLGSFR